MNPKSKLVIRALRVQPSTEGGQEGIQIIRGDLEEIWKAQTFTRQTDRPTKTDKNCDKDLDKETKRRRDGEIERRRDGQTAAAAADQQTDRQH
jgi:hypothetical protein